MHEQPSFLKKITPFFLKQHNYIARLEVDNTRHILYCLVYYSNDQNLFKIESVTYSSLFVYDLGADGTKFIKLGEINQELICERYNQINMRQEKERNFIIKEVFPLTRKDSKYYHLILVTKNGLRAYISFDVEINDDPIKNESSILEKNPNAIYRCRPTMKYSIILKHLPEPTNSNLFDYRTQDKGFRILADKSFERQMFFLDQKFILFYKDEFKKQSYLDIIEFDDTINLKSDLNSAANKNFPQSSYNIAYDSYNYYNSYGSSSPSAEAFKNSENITNVMSFDYTKEIHGFFRNSGNTGKSDHFMEISNLLKSNAERSQDSTSVPAFVNFLDSDNFISVECMNRFAKQIFEIPEQYIVFTSSELIFLNKTRPLDELFKILLESEDIQNNKIPLTNDFIIFLNKYGISETAYMLLAIFTTYNLKFNFYENNIMASSSGFNPFVKPFPDSKLTSEKFNKNVNSMDIVSSSVDVLSSSSFKNININTGKALSFLRQIKNNELIMKKAFDYYMRLLDFDTICLNEQIQGFDAREQGI